MRFLVRPTVELFILVQKIELYLVTQSLFVHVFVLFYCDVDVFEINITVKKTTHDITNG